MAIPTAAERAAKLRQIIGCRIYAARKLADMSQDAVAHHLGHENATQISLWESGERMPKLLDMIGMAELFAVPLDYLSGTSDDPLADAAENNQSFRVRLVANTIAESTSRYHEYLAQQVGVALQGQNQDRSDLQRIAIKLKDVKHAHRRMAQLNPEYEEEWRGSATLEAALRGLEDVITGADARIAGELKHCEIIEREFQVANGEFDRRMRQSTAQNVKQISIDLIADRADLRDRAQAERSPSGDLFA